MKMATLESSFISGTVLAAAAAAAQSHNHSCPQTINLGGARGVSSPVASRTRTLTLSSNFTTRTRRFHLLFCRSAFHLEEQEEKVPLPPPQQQHTTNLNKLYVCNLPWSLSPAHIKSLFSQCGTVTNVEVIKNKNGRLTGFAFVTMASGEQAQAAIHKFHSHQISGKIIRVERAKRFKKPRPPGPPADETCHKIFASNLAWKVRSGHLKEFVARNFKKPVSARVVFDSPSGRCAGYGFVSFITKEEAEDAISALDGKELMGRPVRLKFSRKTVEDAGVDKDEEQGYDDQLEVS